MIKSTIYDSWTFPRKRIEQKKRCGSDALVPGGIFSILKLLHLNDGKSGIKLLSNQDTLDSPRSTTLLDNGRWEVKYSAGCEREAIVSLLVFVHFVVHCAFRQ